MTKQIQAEITWLEFDDPNCKDRYGFAFYDLNDYKVFEQKEIYPSYESAKLAACDFAAEKDYEVVNLHDIGIWCISTRLAMEEQRNRDAFEMIVAIKARFSGVWDNPSLVKLGELSIDPLYDVKRWVDEFIERYEVKVG